MLVDYIDVDQLIKFSIDEFVKWRQKLTTKISNAFQKIALKCNSILSMDDAKDIILGKHSNDDPKIDSMKI